MYNYLNVANASRECFQNATWSTWSNYRSCVPLALPEDEYIQVFNMIYYTFYKTFIQPQKEIF